MPELENVVRLEVINEDVTQLPVRKEFKLKYFNAAGAICCLVAAIVILLLISVWIRFEYKEANV